MKFQPKKADARFCLLCGTKENFYDPAEPLDLRDKKFDTEEEAKQYIEENTPKKLPAFSHKLYSENNCQYQAFFCVDCVDNKPMVLGSLTKDPKVILVFSFEGKEDKVMEMW